MEYKTRSSRTNKRRQRGLTLVEILVVVTILGLIAGIVGVAVINTLEDTQKDATKAQISELGKSLDIYKVKFGRYPNSTEGLNSLLNPPNGKKPIIEKLPKDAWSSDFVYLSPGQHNPAKYDIYSKGPDGQGGTEDDITNWEE